MKSNTLGEATGFAGSAPSSSKLTSSFFSCFFLEPALVFLSSSDELSPEEDYFLFFLLLPFSADSSFLGSYDLLAAVVGPHLGALPL